MKKKIENSKNVGDFSDINQEQLLDFITDSFDCLAGEFRKTNKPVADCLEMVKQSYEMLLFIVVNNYNKKNASLTHQVALI